jgi:aminopeptidase
MKTLYCIISLILPLLAAAQSVNYDAIAHRVVNQSLEVRPGEVVMIHGDHQQQEILEALYVAVHKAGGHAILRLRLPDADVRVAQEVDVKYLKQPEWATAVINRLADCVISVSSVDDPGRWKDLKPEVMAAFRESADKTRMVGGHDRIRFVSVGQSDGIPTEALAKLYGADYMAIKSDFWNAMNVDHRTLENTGNRVLANLKPGAQCQVKSPHGTSIKFRLANTEAMMSCGKTTDQKGATGSTYAWLPAGDAFTAIDPTSANGVIVIPAYYFNAQKFTNLKIDFSNGTIQKISADQNVDDLSTRMLGKGASAVPLSALDLGLNSQSKVRGDYRSFEMAGMVSLGVGDNDWAGGNINNGISYNFHLVDATLVVDGKDVVKSGSLIP